MITLLEAPGSVRRGFASLEDEQTNEMFDDDDIEWSEEEEYNEPVEPNCVDRCLAVGRRPDEADFSEKWKREFSKRPTWFHADMALHQILRGRATGFRWPLYSRILIQRSLFGIGCFVQRHAWLIIVFVLALFTLFCCGLRYVYIETDIVKLWVSEGGRLNEELNFLSTLQKANRRNLTQDSPYEQRHFLSEDLDERLFEIPEDEAPISSYQVLIQTADHLTPSRNVLTKKELLRHVQLLHEITQLRVHKFGLLLSKIWVTSFGVTLFCPLFCFHFRNWTLDDICFKPGALDIGPDSMAYALKPTLERLIPCIWITPVDCFFEGAKPLGPSPPIDINNIPMGSLLQLMVDDIPDQVSWTNLDPEHVVSQVIGNFDLGTIKNFFMRSGIGRGYQERVQRSLFGIGCFVQRHAWLIIVFVLALFTLFCCGLRYVYIETDIVKLWVSEGGRLNEELNFLSTLQKANRRNLTQDSPYEQRHFLSEDLDERLFEIPEDEAPISSYQVLIQTADHLTPSRNVLTKKELLRHVQLLHEITQLRVHKFGL
uniref:SSD domain-containing protein n=1 Tax=Globodera pallida TaxID=36090 RepID=A0A183CJZ2_GLOPA